MKINIVMLLTNSAGALSDKTPTSCEDEELKMYTTRQKQLLLIYEIYIIIWNQGDGRK